MNTAMSINTLDSANGTLNAVRAELVEASATLGHAQDERVTRCRAEAK